MTIVTLGIDLARNIFALHGVGTTGKPKLIRPEVRRSRLLEVVASLPPYLIGMATCSGAHHWAREFEKFGHTVRLMAPEFVAPYRMAGKRGKNDANDAAAICEAVTRHNSKRLVPAAYFGERDRRFRERDRFGGVWHCAVLIVDFLVSSGRVRAPGRWVLGMPF